MKLGPRNAEKVLKALSEDSDPSKPVIAQANLVIQIPARFREIGLAQVGTPSYVFGLFAIILESGEYALFSANAFVELGPCTIDKVVINDQEHYNFHFQKGDVVIRTRELVKRSELIYKGMEEFIFQGKVPWYVGYEDMGKIFDSAKYHSGTKAEIQPAIMEFMAAYNARYKNNRIKFIREVATSYGEFDKQLAWVPMRSVYWSAPGTVNKLSGAYFEDGIVSALVNPSEREEKIERILRS